MVTLDDGLGVNGTGSVVEKCDYIEVLVLNESTGKGWWKSVIILRY